MEVQGPWDGITALHIFQTARQDRLPWDGIYRLEVQGPLRVGVWKLHQEIQGPPPGLLEQRIRQQEVQSPIPLAVACQTADYIK